MYMQQATCGAMRIIIVVAAVMCLAQCAQAFKVSLPFFRKKKTRTPAEVLGVPADASCAVTRRAYLAKSFEHHPDKGGDQDEVRNCYCFNQCCCLHVCARCSSSIVMQVLASQMNICN
jgi:preprotein translocase subunit Sec63